LYDWRKAAKAVVGEPTGSTKIRLADRLGTMNMEAQAVFVFIKKGGNI